METDKVIRLHSGEALRAECLNSFDPERTYWMVATDPEGREYLTDPRGVGGSLAVEAANDEPREIVLRSYCVDSTGNQSLNGLRWVTSDLLAAVYLDDHVFGAHFQVQSFAGKS